MELRRNIAVRGRGEGRVPPRARATTRARLEITFHSPTVRSPSRDLPPKPRAAPLRVDAAFFADAPIHSRRFRMCASSIPLTSSVGDTWTVTLSEISS